MGDGRQLVYVLLLTSHFSQTGTLCNLGSGAIEN